MANLIELEQWEEGIYQLETDDPVLGGEDGIDNLQAKQLGNRTKWLKAQLLLRALIDSPEFTGTPKVPTAAPGTNNTQAASTAFTKAAIDAAIAALVDSSPGALDTLNELAAALGDDPNFATTITNALALKAPWSTIDEVITAAGMTPDHDVLTQLRDAIQELISQNQKSIIIHDAEFEASVVDGNAVYWHFGNGEFTKALADGSAAQNAVGFADVTNEKVYVFGAAPIFIGLTPGAYYLDGTTPGAITTTPPATNIVKLGIAVSATEMYVDIDAAGVTPKADQAEVDAGSEDGKFVTPLKLTNGFAISLGTLSYIKLPTWLGGWIVQFGIVGNNASISTDDTQTYSFPLTFPNACRAIFSCLNRSSAISGAWTVYNSITSASQFTVSIDASSSTSPTGRSTFFIAIGN